MRFLVLLACALLACGARTSLGGERPVANDAGADADAAKPTCDLGDLSTWKTERYRDQGDYVRAVASTSGTSWVALAPRGGDLLLAELAVDSKGIAMQSSISIPSAPVYPFAMDVDDRRFVVLTTSGPNFDGDVELFRVDRTDGTVLRVPGGSPTNPTFTLYGALALAGEDVVVAYAHPADGGGVVEIRDDHLNVQATRSVTETSFTAVHASATAVDVYLGATSALRVENGGFQPAPVDPAWQVIGGVEDYRVAIGTSIRMTEGTHTWTGAWPHTQISPPAVARVGPGGAVFSLETELTGVVGRPSGDALEWLSIEPAEGAPGTGLVLLPNTAPGRLGVFYLGLEIPQPEQPLRYYGLVCE